MIDRAFPMMFAATIGLALTLSTLVWAGDPVLPLAPADQKILVEQLGADVVGEPVEQTDQRS